MSLNDSMARIRRESAPKSDQINFRLFVSPFD
jgi:hypothetical protein